MHGPVARNDALASGHTVINAVVINSQSNFIYVTEKLTVGHCFWSHTQPQTAPSLKLFEDRGRAHAHHANICTKTQLELIFIGTLTHFCKF